MGMSYFLREIASFAEHEMARKSMRQLVFFLGGISASNLAGVQRPTRWLAWISTCKLLASTTSQGTIRPSGSGQWYRGTLVFIYQGVIAVNNLHDLHLQTEQSLESPSPRLSPNSALRRREMFE